MFLNFTGRTYVIVAAVLLRGFDQPLNSAVPNVARPMCVSPCAIGPFELTHGLDMVFRKPQYLLLLSFALSLTTSIRRDYCSESFRCALLIGESGQGR